MSITIEIVIPSAPKRKPKVWVFLCFWKPTKCLREKSPQFSAISSRKWQWDQSECFLYCGRGVVLERLIGSNVYAYIFMFTYILKVCISCACIQMTLGNIPLCKCTTVFYPFIHWLMFSLFLISDIYEYSHIERGWATVFIVGSNILWGIFPRVV